MPNEEEMRVWARTLFREVGLVVGAEQDFAVAFKAFRHFYDEGWADALLFADPTTPKENQP